MTVKNPEERLCFDESLPPGIVLQALCRPLFNSNVNLSIHADDEMLYFFLFTQGYPFEQAVAIYLESGRLIWRTLRQVIAWRFGSPAGVRLLDFASGYGRVTRHIVAEVPPESVWVSDIYAAGVAFQERQFGVHGVVSTTDPASIELPSGFDCILVSSLFTHLPAPRFTAWLRRLGQALAPGGMLLFSVHDPSLAPAAAADRGGITFEPMSESGSLSKEEYGTAWVGERFVRAAIGETMGDGCAVHRIRRGLASFQDLYVVVAPTAPGHGAGAAAAPPDFSRLRLERAADGFVEHCSRLGKRRLLLSGWISDRVTGQPPSEVRVTIDGVLAAASRDLTPRASQTFAADPTPAAGWRVEVELPPQADADRAQLAITVLSSEGEEIELFSDSVLGALLRSAQVEAFLLKTGQGEVERRETSLRATIEELRQSRDDLTARFRAVEAGHLWKLRNAWLRCKRLAGLSRP
jgi:SAM-dependent methyltransferase